MRQNVEQWPLRRLNLIAMPAAILLAIRAGFGWTVVSCGRGEHAACAGNRQHEASPAYDSVASPLLT